MSDTLIIPLTRGKSVVIDAGDLNIIAGYTWQARLCGKRWYAGAAIKHRRRQRHIYMHRLLMSAVAGQEVDHIDGDGLNNRRSNLRFCTRSQNNANRRTETAARSGYRGVYPRRHGWYGRVKKDRIYHFTATFENADEAAAARDLLAKTLFGEFASETFR